MPALGLQPQQQLPATARLAHGGGWGARWVCWVGGGAPGAWRSSSCRSGKAGQARLLWPSGVLRPWAWAQLDSGPTPPHEQPPRGSSLLLLCSRQQGPGRPALVPLSLCPAGTPPLGQWQMMGVEACSAGRWGEQLRATLCLGAKSCPTVPALRPICTPSRQGPSHPQGPGPLPE